MIIFLGSVIGSMIDPIQFIAVIICVRFKIWAWIYIPALTAAILILQKLSSPLHYDYFSIRNISARIIAITITAIGSHYLIKFAARMRKPQSESSQYE